MRFAVGDAVRTCGSAAAAHTRLPAYLCGRCGEIEAIAGSFPLPDIRALGRADAPLEMLYTVRFRATAVGFAHDGAILADLFESYLERA